MPSTINRQLRERGEVRNEIAVHVKYSDIEVQFHCFYCCKGIFRQRARIIAVFAASELEPEILATIPISIQCSRCGCIYHILTINK